MGIASTSPSSTLLTTPKMSSALTKDDLRHILDCLHDQIETQMDLWEAGGHKDKELDNYIDTLCDVKDKIKYMIQKS